MAIPIRSPAELDAMRRAGEGARRVLDACLDACRPGATTRRIDEAGAREIGRLGAACVRGTTTTAGATPFPGHLCVNLNEEAAHAVPGDRIVRDGDLVSIDVAVAIDGWWADMAEPVAVGRPADEGRAVRLRDAARRVTGAAIDAMGPGVAWGRVAELVRQAADRLGVGLVEGLDGHAIGRRLHEQPRLSLGAGSAGDLVLRPGMTVTVEPTVTDGSGGTIAADDGWTVLTEDRGWACFRERTVAITGSGAVLLTPDGADG
jgi:methionyl aminopeptidase